MFDTTFEDSVTAANNERKRSETLPGIHKLHDIPKQVSDTVQSVGVNEKFMESGLPSGVLLPSQISHDRWLSIGDAFVDNLYIFFIASICVASGFNLVTGTILTIGFLYMLFHIVWWQKGIAWETSETVVEYLNQTRKYYWFFLYFFMIFVSIGGSYLFLKHDGPKHVNNAITWLQGFIDKAIYMYDNLNVKTNDLMTNITPKVTESEVSEFEPLNSTVTQTVQTASTSQPVKDVLQTLADYIATVNIDMNKYLIGFLIFYTVAFIFIYLCAKFYEKHYTAKRSTNIKQAHKEKRHHIETTIDDVEEFFN